jgi:hypothetical protein
MIVESRNDVRNGFWEGLVGSSPKAILECLGYSATVWDVLLFW